MKTIRKDPNAVFPVKVDLKAYTNGTSTDPDDEWLESSETISTIDTVLVSPTGELTVDSLSTADAATAVEVWLSGGLLGRRYLVTVRVTTSSGRTDDFSFYIAMQSK